MTKAYDYVTRGKLFHCFNQVLTLGDTLKKSVTQM